MPTWLIENPLAVWLIAAIILGVIEMLSLDFFCLMLSGGCLAAAVSALFTDRWTIHVLVFAMVSIVLIFLVRPLILKRFRNSSPQTVTNVDRLVGQRVEVLEAVSATSGLIRLEGDHWTARMIDHTGVLAAGSTAVVERIDGATAVVRPDRS